VIFKKPQEWQDPSKVKALHGISKHYCFLTTDKKHLVDFRKTPCACGDCLNGNHDQCSRVDFNGQLERHNLAKGSINKKRKPKDAAPGSQPAEET